MTAPAEQNPQEVMCLKCEVPMVKKAAVSQVAEASANAPARSSNQAPVAVATATGRTKTKAAKATKAAKSGTKTRSTARSRAAEAEAAIAIVIPEFGSFRCPCCGMAKTILPGEGKTGVPARCQTCFVKLEFLK
jgi:hypothetical protein